MDFQGHLENAWRLLREHPFLFLLGGLLVQLLAALSLGLLAGPLAGGFLLMMIDSLRESRRPVLNDLFCGLSRFGQLFPFFFLALLIMLGFLFFFIPGVIFATWWIYALPLMADRKMSLGEAMQASRGKVKEKGFFLHLVFLFMITVLPAMLINVAAAIIPPLEALQLFLFPAQAALLASLYLEQFHQILAEKSPQQAAACGPPPPPPPPAPEIDRSAERGLD